MVNDINSNLNILNVEDYLGLNFVLRSLLVWAYLLMYSLLEPY